MHASTQVDRESIPVSHLVQGCVIDSLGRSRAFLRHRETGGQVIRKQPAPRTQVKKF